MKIERFEVIGLNGREAKLSASFGDGVNILTGRNGAGKTSLLKLLWYIIRWRADCYDRRREAPKVSGFAPAPLAFLK
jgi:ABC-type multidrug transport system ATPase subunit